tara:strand:- start:807 stop:932 length:126 start_codon:yes stop_codon:yes gene_type:complete
MQNQIAIDAFYVRMPKRLLHGASVSGSAHVYGRLFKQKQGQ